MTPMTTPCTAKLPNGTPVFVETSMNDLYIEPETMVLAFEECGGELIAHEVSLGDLDDVTPEE